MQRREFLSLVTAGGAVIVGDRGGPNVPTPPAEIVPAASPIKIVPPSPPIEIKIQTFGDTRALEDVIKNEVVSALRRNSRRV